MMRVEEIVEQTETLRRSDLEAWINEELIAPETDSAGMVFSEMECARIRLICSLLSALCSLRYELEVEADTLPVIMSLIDQLYETRHRLLKLAAAVSAQDKPIRAAILALVEGDEDASVAWFTDPYAVPAAMMALDDRIYRSLSETVSEKQAEVAQNILVPFARRMSLGRLLIAFATLALAISLVRLKVLVEVGALQYQSSRPLLIETDIKN
jgi:chaperone modulatory protein CbpM